MILQTCLTGKITLNVTKTDLVIFKPWILNSKLNQMIKTFSDKLIQILGYKN